MDSNYYEDSYNLDNVMIKYILPRLKAYLRIADRKVNLDWDGNSYEFNGERIVLGEAIRIVIAEFEHILEDDYREESKEVLILFGKIFSSLWW